MPELSPEDRALLKEVTEKFAAADERHKLHRPQWSHRYSLYRSYEDYRKYASGQSRGVYPRLNDATREFGADLVIPVVFWTIETVLPRLLSQSPRMLVLPRDPQSEENADNMKFLIDAQQEQIDYQLKLQDLAKDGLIYGLGVQKTFWRKDIEMRTALSRSILPDVGVQWVERPSETTLFDDPDVEAVSPFDFFWDPYGYDIASCRYVIHRLWLSTEEVADRIKSGVWAHNEKLQPKDVDRMGSRVKYDEAWGPRLEAQGLSGASARSDIHEVWEFHDRKRVVTILDREIPVQVGDAPYWHRELPFQIYRPTRVNKEFVGIGEAEILEDLSYELSTMRSQRRDNATLVLQKTFAFYDGLVDPADLKFGPGLGIPVNGDPRELLFPIPVGDIPNSSYQEEAALLADIERATGISDSVTGSEGQGTSQTATGAQLLHAAANVRIQNKTKLLEKEPIRHAARQFGALNQQRILTNREIRIPAPPEPGQAERRWAWRQVGPAELAGDFDYIPEGGATAPENVPQMRQDAQFFEGLLQNPNVDPAKVTVAILKNLGIERPETWLVQPDQQVPMDVLQRLEQGGVPHALIQAAVGQSQAASQNGNGQ